MLLPKTIALNVFAIYELLNLPKQCFINLLFQLTHHISQESLRDTRGIGNVKYQLVRLSSFNSALSKAFSAVCSRVASVTGS